jgi:phosphopentomutase
MKRFFLIVLDGVGAGEMPDAGDYDDEGANTLGNLARAVGGLELPVLESLGLGNVIPIEGVAENTEPLASWGLMKELSRGKDTITGHWEMAGIISSEPFPTYPGGFPPELIAEFERLIGRKGLWYKRASGTAILEQLGDEHMRTGSPIVYTSADSVFQIAAHEDVIPPEELYDICRKARAMLAPPHNICRVIARPFVGPPFERTYLRKDFPLEPPSGTVMDLLVKEGHEVLNVGKVIDMFNSRGFTGGRRTQGNADGTAALDECAGWLKHGLVFANLVDFDTLWGHRNDTAGFYSALREFDSWLEGFVERMKEDDFLVITADHGLDPTTPGTDHTREYVPLLFYGPQARPRDLGTRNGFWDVGATIADVFNIEGYEKGRSFM